MRSDLEGGRVPYLATTPRWHAHGRATCWGPKVVTVHRSHLAAMIDALWHRVLS